MIIYSLIKVDGQNTLRVQTTYSKTYFKHGNPSLNEPDVEFKMFDTNVFLNLDKLNDPKYNVFSLWCSSEEIAMTTTNYGHDMTIHLTIPARIRGGVYEICDGRTHITSSLGSEVCRIFADGTYGSECSTNPDWNISPGSLELEVISGLSSYAKFVETSVKSFLNANFITPVFGICSGKIQTLAEACDINIDSTSGYDGSCVSLTGDQANKVHVKSSHWTKKAVCYKMDDGWVNVSQHVIWWDGLYIQLPDEDYKIPYSLKLMNCETILYQFDSFSDVKVSDRLYISEDSSLGWHHHYGFIHQVNKVFKSIW